MTLDTNFNVNPYNDDFDNDKKYYRLLFKPGYAVQARELTQIQSSLQAQIGRFGNHVFKNGSLVTGGEFFVHRAKYIKLQDTYASAEVNVDEFTKKTVYSSQLDEDGKPIKRAEVLKVYDYNPGNGDPKTLLVAQLYGNDFTENETIRTFEVSGLTNVFATTANTSASGDALLFSVNEGVFYYDGYFIYTGPQTVAISKYSYNDANASARIGFEIIESIINASEDSSLLDPAQDASNYQAPGSDRYKVELALVARDLQSTDDNKFIELMRVENGVIISQNKFPIYSVLEDTFARRTYDESGNYTVRPFSITLETNSSNTAKANIVLSPGKAYVFGYEYETISPTTITVDKPRTTQNVLNEYQTAEYGNFVYTTKHRGSFPINTLESINLHCVSAESINTTSLATLSNTKIGTARIKSVEFFESTNSANSNTYVYQTFVFDVQVTSSISSNVVSATSNTLVIANTTLGNFYSTVQNAYRGAKIKIVSGPGSNELPKTIVGFNASTQTVSISSLQEYRTVPTSESIFSIDFETGDVESFAAHTGTGPMTLVCSGDIENKSRDLSTDYSYTFISSRNKEPLLFKIGQDYVTQNSISDFTYSYKRLYKNIQFDGGVVTLSSLSGQELESSKREDYYISVVNKGTSSFSNNQVVPYSVTTIDRESGELTITGAENMIADIIAPVKVTSDTFSVAKIKNLITANVNSIETLISPIDVFGNCSAIVYPSNGVTRIASTALSKVPGTSQSLYVSDVRSIIKIVDIGNTSFTQANVANGTNVTSRFTLDNGQRDSFYDHSSIRLNSKSQAPTGNLVVFYDRFKSSGAGSFFSVDSYSHIPYEEIPSYIATSNGTKYELRDCLDFRPVRKDGEFIFDITNPSQAGPGIPGISSAMDLEYEYFLPRIDKVILDKERKFKIIQGIPSLNPLEPRDSETAMTLFILRYTPYTGNTKEVKIRHIDHKRYTMRDIGRIDKRVENLEYYTALSLLEQQTLSQQDFTILDSQNLPRFKNGILVDNFTGFSATDVENRDYSAGIDSQIKEMVPKVNDVVYDLDFDSGSNHMISGSLITRSADNVEFIFQPKASMSVNVNPFNVVRFEGTISLHPDADTWVDTQRLPDLVIDDTAGEMAAWNLVAQTAFSVTRSAWTTHWFGITDESELRGGVRTEGQQTRTVTTTTLVPERVTQNYGDRVVDVSIVPFMRRVAIVTISTGMKPNTVMYPFFDNIPIDPFFLPLNNIVLEKSIFGLVDDFRTVGNPVPAEIRDWNNPSSNIKVLITHASGNNVHLIQDPTVQPVVWGTSPIFGENANSYLKVLATDLVEPLPTLPEVQLIGGNLVANIKSYIHNGGVLTGSVNYPLGATTIKISDVVHWNVSNVQNMVHNYSYFVGETITFVKQGNIFVSTITGYNQNTTELTFSPALPFAFERTTSGPSYYIIGKPRTDVFGAVTGIFFVPPGIFRTGPKSFRLIDNDLNDIGSSFSWGDAQFYSQGLLQTVQSTIVSTIQMRPVTTSTVETRPIFYDPIAQTFAVDPVVYPKGIFLSKVRVCFKTKDDGNVPVTLQLRPTVNGYPSSTEIYPYSSTVKMPESVKITDAPSLSDPTKYTEFVFESPVYLLPGEHCFVLLSDSNKYEIWAAEMGGRDVVTSSIISEQPYGGSFFKSQNARTWSADQNIDMTFSLYRCKFGTTPASVLFKIRADQVTANHDYDLICFGVTDIQPPGTAIKYEFDSISSETNAYADYKEIVPIKNYQLNDGSGMRTMTTNYGSESFYLRAILLSDSTDVSPVVKRDTLTVHAVKNIINDLELSEDDVVILSGGSNYTSNASVLISGGGGSGANAYAVRDATTNTISGIVFDNPGSGYMSNPTISVFGGGLSASGANVFYNGETSKSGGNAEVRHLTKVITLADGFDSADLRVYLTAYKPPGSKIYVYYKVIAESDPETLADKSWQLMTQVGQENVFSETKDQYREITYSPGENGIPSNLISYDGYGTFKSFQIKVVLSSIDSTDPPRLNDLRVVALPGETT